MFNRSLETHGVNFFHIVASSVERDALLGFSKGAAFHAPNDFKFAEFLQVLREREFPKGGFYEFQWAIYECGLDAVRAMPPWMKLFVSSVYVYCNKRRQWGMTVDSDYLFLIAEQSVKSGSAYAGAATMFIEWVGKFVIADDGYEDYFLLIAWLVLKRISEEIDADFFEAVSILQSRNNLAQQIEELSESMIPASDWLALVEKLPPVGGVGKDTWTKIIGGR